MSLLDDYEASLNITAPQSLLELVEQQRQVHVLNESAFTDFTSQHRPHQVQAITAIKQLLARARMQSPPQLCFCQVGTTIL